VHVQVLLALWSLSSNDAFKAELVKAKLLELAMDMIAIASRARGGDGQRGLSLEMVLEMIYNLVFCPAAATRLRCVVMSQTLVCPQPLVVTCSPLIQGVAPSFRTEKSC
jgi:hypothetical protein